MSRQRWGVLFSNATGTQMYIVGKAPLIGYVPSASTAVAQTYKGRFVMGTWRESVYRLPEEELDFDSRAWRSIRWQVLKRDRFTCQRCWEKFRHGHGLNVHHIRPRDLGGDDHPFNLISLCEHCHDLVEGMGYRTRAAIMGSELPDTPEPKISLEVKPVSSWASDDTYPCEMWLTGHYSILVDSPNLIKAYRKYYKFNEAWYLIELDCETGIRTGPTEIGDRFAVNAHQRAHKEAK